ncbi:MAG TPA: C25 family cysteine peptidase, partial [Bacteroidota bacterium]
MRPASIIGLIVVFALVFLATAPRLFSQSVIPDLKSPNNRFDYVVISPPAYVAAVQPLALRRLVHNGFAVGFAVTDSIYSSFGKGTTADTAIKRLITFAIASWKAPAPKYFLLTGNVNTVPSHREEGFTFAGEDSIMVDQWFVEAGADSGLPGRFVASLGRLPAWNLAGLNVMVSKIAAYEDSPEQSWMRRSISVADSTDAPVFEDVANALQNALSTAWPDTVSVHVKSSSPHYLSRVQFRSLWDHGAAIVSLIGSANWYQFSHGAYFTTWDVDSLAPGSPLPFCL